MIESLKSNFSPCTYPLVRAGEQLGQAITSLEQGLEPDVAAIDLENALDALGEISGKSPSEEVLTAIFAKFCLGK